MYRRHMHDEDRITRSVGHPSRKLIGTYLGTLFLGTGCCGCNYPWGEKAVAFVGLLSHNVFWILAFLPAIVAFGYWALSGRKKYSERKEAVRLFRRQLRDVQYQQDRTIEVPLPETGPGYSEFFLGSVVVTLPFLLVAWMATAAPCNDASRESLTISAIPLCPDGGSCEREKERTPAEAVLSVGSVRTGGASSNAVTAGTGGTPDAGGFSDGGVGAPVPSDGGTAYSNNQEGRPGTPYEAWRGTIIAGYAAFLYLLMTLMFRVNLSAVTNKFLVFSGIRSTVAFNARIYCGTNGYLQRLG